MSKLLIFGNFELSFDGLAEDCDTAELVQQKEEEILRLLRRVARRGDHGGDVEAFEFETFVYSDELESEPKQYYYNKHEKETEVE